MIWKALSGDRIAMESGHPEAASKGVFNLGLLLEDVGMLRGAILAYRRASAWTSSGSGARAALQLGILLKQIGRLPEVQAAFEQPHAAKRPTAASRRWVTP